MQIQQTGAQIVARLYQRQPTSDDGASASVPAGRPRTDSVVVSAARKEVARLQAVAGAAPDVRSDRVASLRAAIAGGTYQVDSGALAQRMLA